MLTVIAFIASAVAWGWFIRRADRFEREPIGSILYVTVVGGFLSGLCASVLNVGMMSLLGVGNGLDGAIPAGPAAILSVFIGLNEEFFKALFTVILVRRMKTFNEPLDAIVYAMSVGLGFAVFENIEYVGAGGLQVLISRTLTSMPLHVGLAALWGSGIAMARWGGDDRWVRCILPMYLAAAPIHAIYDFAILAFPDSVAPALISLPALLLTVFIARRIIRSMAERSPFRPAGHCIRCNTPNPSIARFCAHCGRQLQPRPVEPVSTTASGS